ncbi:MAG: hypothetical protein M5U34_23035 [Chloroflexi bacterium]|nr:hypothetical protein [Chloroflexota bacterium]
MFTGRKTRRCIFFANAPQLDNMLSLTHEIKRQEGDQLILTGHIEEGKTQLTLKAGQRIALQPLTAPPRFSPDEFALPSAPCFCTGANGTNGRSRGAG